MDFALLGFILVTFVASNQSLARIIRIERQADGIDHFEVLEDDNDNLCAATEKATEFCAKYGAVHVANTRTCRGNQEPLHCRCNSTDSTFLLHEERCVKNANVTRYLNRRAFTGCRHHLIMQDVGFHHTSRRCDQSPVPTLLTDTNDKRGFSVCTAYVSQEVLSCTPDMKNSWYFYNGQWRKIWGLELGRTAALSQASLEKVLIKLSSNGSKWKGLLVSLQATCRAVTGINLRLRGQAPPEKIQACLLLKISGSNSSTLKPHQMSFTESIFRNYDLVDHNRTLRKNDLGNMTRTKPQIPTSPTDKTNKDRVLGKDSSWTSDVLGAFYGVVLLLVVLITVWLTREEYLRWNKGMDRKGRQRTQKGYTVGNPTYERGVDNSLDLTHTTDVNHSVVSPYAVIPCAQVYQPTVENTRPRPHGGNSCSNFYESLKSVGENILPRRASYRVNRDSKGTTTGSSGAESLFQTVDEFPETRGKNPGHATNESVFAASANSDTSQGNSVPSHSRKKQRSRSEGSGGRRITVNTKPKKKSSSLSDRSDISIFNANGRCDFNLDEIRLRMETTELDEGKGLSRDGIKADDLTGTCQSSLSSSQQEEESLVENGFGTNSPTLFLTARKLNEDSLENKQAADSNGEAHQQVNTYGDSSFTNDAVRDSLNDRLSDLEIIIDSDCSEYDEMENQSDKCEPFYYVLEGPDPTTLATLV